MANSNLEYEMLVAAFALRDAQFAADYGRILAGIQVPDSESAELEEHLQELGYAHWDESNNPAYAMFLS